MSSAIQAPAEIMAVVQQVAGVALVHVPSLLQPADRSDPAAGGQAAAGGLMLAPPAGGQAAALPTEGHGIGGGGGREPNCSPCTLDALGCSALVNHLVGGWYAVADAAAAQRVVAATVPAGRPPVPGAAASAAPSGAVPLQVMRAGCWGIDCWGGCRLPSARSILARAGQVRRRAWLGRGKLWCCASQSRCLRVCVFRGDFHSQAW
jgi:hypothetical protein